jgi:DMSO/TMAO reductase YedYZ molybdopterin-dependent catalytic subunit
MTDELKKPDVGASEPATPAAAPVAAAAARAPEPIPEPEPPKLPPAMPDRDFRRKTRREILKLTPLVLAGAFTSMALRERIFNRSLGFTDWATGVLFSRTRLAPTFSDSDVVPFENFPYNGYDDDDPGVDLENWTLTVEGAVQHSGEYKIEQIKNLPKISQNTRHVCVEGWDAIGSFGGARISDFLALVGADANARFLEVECADDYYESIDMASALHPQSLLCYEMYGKPIDRGHGAPVRLQMPTKLGYKQAKYLTVLRVTNVLKPDRRGYWVDQGYDWYGGL